MSYDDDLIDDDEYYDDEDEDLEDNDEQIGFDRSSVNPFRSGGSSSGGSGLPGGGSRFGSSGSGTGGSSRFGSNSPGSRDDLASRLSASTGGSSSDDDSKPRSPVPGSSRFGSSGGTSGSSTPSSAPGGGSSRFGSSGSGGSGGTSGSSRFGSGGSDDDSKPRSPASPASGRTGGTGPLGGSSSRFGSSPTDRQPASKPESSDSSGGGRFGSGFGSGGKDDKKNQPAAKKDEKSGGGALGGLTSRLPFGGGKSDKKDQPAAKKDEKSGGGALGGLTSRLPFGGGKSDKKDQPAAKRDAKSAGGTAVGGALGGLTSRLPFGGGNKDGKKGDQSAPRKDAKAKPGTGGGSRFGAIGGRLGFGNKSGDATSGSSASPKDTGTFAKNDGRRSDFGKERGGKPEMNKPGIKAGGAAASSGGFLSALTSRLPFGGSGDAEKRSQKTSKTRASKVPHTKEDGGLSLDDKLDMVGVGLIIGSVLLILSSMSQEQGALTGAVNGTFSYILGWGAIGVPLTMFAIGAWLIRRHFGENAPEIDLVRLTGVIVLYLTGLVFLTFMETFHALYATVTTVQELVMFLPISVEAGRGGGVVGAEMYVFLIINVTEIGAIVTIIGFTILGLMLTTRTTGGELMVFFISLWRSLQLSVQHRAQRQRAIRVEAQQRSLMEQQQQISVSKPAPAELGAGALNALPEPSADNPISIEDRPIPIRMGGQILPSQNQPVQVMAGGVQQPQPAAAQQASTGGGSSSGGSGLFGRITGALPFVGTKDQENGQSTAQPQPVQPQVAAPQQPVVETPAVQPAATQPTASPAPFGSPQQAAFQPQSSPPAARPAASTGTPTQSPFTKPAQPQQPAASFEAPAPATPVTQSPTPAKPQFGRGDDDDEDRGSLRFGSTAAAGGLAGGLAAKFAAKHDDDEETTTSFADRQSRLNSIRAGNTARPRSDLGSLLDDINDDDDENEDDSHAPEDQFGASLRPSSPLKPRPFSPSGAPESSAQRPASGFTSNLSKPPDAGGTGFTPPTRSASMPPRVDQPAAHKDDQSEPVINTPRPVQPTQPAPAPVARVKASYRLPDIRSLMSSGSEQEFDRESLVRQARIIEETLQSFGAPGRVVEINTGPVITQYGVEPDYMEGRGGKKNRVKVSAIAQLDKDLQLSLGAKSIRIEAPVPGKGYVGIEVPNEEASLVSLRDVMEADQFARIKSPLAIALGQSVDGAPISADLASMPHLLVAGTTGSGKSVCVNSIIASLITRNTPDVVKFIMVDPKRVELTGYNGIPHLVAPVVVELERIVGVLKWVTREMDERYKKFSNAAARNIEDYNAHLPQDADRMPYIVVIIDELADLMMLAPDETERVITRIAALARATGIHLVIATQRPSVDVVTGLIKANFPARIAFAVAGSVDSRVILDQPGAERLLGKGDMLYMSGDSPAPLRLQGVFVSDMEINNIVRFWKTQTAGQPVQKPITQLVMDDSTSEARPVIPRGERFMQSPPPSTQRAQAAFWDDDDEPEDDDDGSGDHEDELYEEAVEMVRRLDKASVSLLQRRLRIGYTRAARLIDTMEAEGIIGPAVEGSKPRKVLPAK